MLTGSSVCSTSNLSTGYGELESVRLKVPVVFFSRPLSFPVTQSYLISWTATREDGPGVLMLIRAVGRQLAGLEEPERRQETRSNTVTEDLLQQAERHEGNETWNCIWSDFEICRMSRGILIKEKIYELCCVLASTAILTLPFKMVQEILNNLVCLCNLGHIVQSVPSKNNIDTCWKWRIHFRMYSRLIIFVVYWFSPKNTMTFKRSRSI